MAQEQASAEASAPKRRGGKMTILLTAIVGVVSAGAGFAVPQLLGGGMTHPSDEASHGVKASKSEHAETGVACVPFGEVVANLDDTRMMRYVRAKFALAVEKKDCQAVQNAVEEKKTVLKNWLIGYLQNKPIEEIRGTQGFNRIRREIEQHFNLVLFPADDGKIQEVLFEEFNVQ